MFHVRGEPRSSQGSEPRPRGLGKQEFPPANECGLKAAGSYCSYCRRNSDSSPRHVFPGACPPHGSQITHAERVEHLAHAGKRGWKTTPACPGPISVRVGVAVARLSVNQPPCIQGRVLPGTGLVTSQHHFLEHSQKPGEVYSSSYYYHYCYY